MLKWAAAREPALSHMFPLWRVKWLLCLWIDGVSLGGPFGERHWPAEASTARSGSFSVSPTPAPPAVPLPALPKTSPSQSHGGPERWATPVKERAPPPPRHPQAACPPATELSGPCSLNAHFVPLSTGLIDINSCAQSAHSVFSWSGAVGVCDYIQCVALSGRDEIWADWTQGKWQSQLQSLTVMTVKVTFSIVMVL